MPFKGSTVAQLGGTKRAYHPCLRFRPFFLLINSFVKWALAHPPQNFNPSVAYMLTKYKACIIDWLYYIDFVNNSIHCLYYELYPHKLNIFFSNGGMRIS